MKKNDIIFTFAQVPFYLISTNKKVSIILINRSKQMLIHYQLDQLAFLN